MCISDVHKMKQTRARGAAGSGLLILCQVAGDGLSEAFCIQWRTEGRKGGEMKGPEETRRLVFPHRGGRAERQRGWQKGRVGADALSRLREDGLQEFCVQGRHRY